MKGFVMKILVLKISDRWTKIFMVLQTNFFKNFGSGCKNFGPSWNGLPKALHSGSAYS